jgi:hypothetical protein
VIRVRPKDRGVFIGDKTRYARDGLYNQRRAEVYRYGEVVTVEKGLESLKERRSGGKAKRVRGTSVDRQRVRKRVERRDKGRRKVEGRKEEKVRQRRYHQGERGLTAETVSDVLSKVENVRTRGRDLKKERPRRQIWRREIRVAPKGSGAQKGGNGFFAQWGNTDYGRATGGSSGNAMDGRNHASGANPGLDRGKTVSSLRERTEGRHRRAQIRTEDSARRRNETRRNRRNPRRLEHRKRRDRVGEHAVVNVVNTQLNTAGRRAVERGREESGKEGNLVRIGVDEGERREQGRASWGQRSEAKGGKVVARRSSHAPRTSQGGEERSDLSLRVPRKTPIESDQRRTNREGKAVWTTGVGATPSVGSETTRRAVGEERSDPIRNHTEEDRERTRRRETKRGSTLDSTWNERRRPDRYDYYREGHSINRVSKVMAKTSMVNQRG